MKYLHPKRTTRVAKEKLHDWFFFYLIPDEWEIKYRFKKKVGYMPNLRNPHSFNEKIQWLKLHDHNPRYPLLIDKLRVKDLVSEVVGKEHIIPTIAGGFKHFDDIPFESLPEQFVLKCNHDAASVVICKDKKTFDYASAKQKLEKALHTNYYHAEGKQWGYKDIVPCIFVEKYMEDDRHDELLDYKFMCFNGIPLYIFVCMGRLSSGLTIDVYDSNWCLLPIRRDVPNSNVDLSAPQELEEMLQMAEKLARFVDNQFVRVDLYVICGKIYFGELTFYPNGGFGQFHPQDWDFIFGEKIGLLKEW